MGAPKWFIYFKESNRLSPKWRRQILPRRRMRLGSVCFNMDLSIFENITQPLSRTAAMISYKQRVSLLEFLYRKPGVILPELAETPETLATLIQDAFDDL